MYDYFTKLKGGEKRMTLSKERQGEIAYATLRYIMTQRGFNLSASSKREIDNIAKAIGASHEEAVEFAEKIVREVVDGIFPPK
ncbi:MAG TPA: hypothetical protein PLA19_04125 [Candidatus Pacearchaeota archaeon]|nr:hypothetical protein [Candidatus Pacearchaeota archaeon]